MMLRVGDVIRFKCDGDMHTALVTKDLGDDSYNVWVIPGSGNNMGCTMYGLHAERIVDVLTQPRLNPI